MRNTDLFYQLQVWFKSFWLLKTVRKWFSLWTWGKLPQKERQESIIAVDLWRGSTPVTLSFWALQSLWILFWVGEAARNLCDLLPVARVKSLNIIFYVICHLLIFLKEFSFLAFISILIITSTPQLLGNYSSILPHVWSNTEVTPEVEQWEKIKSCTICVFFFSQSSPESSS